MNDKAVQGLQCTGHPTKGTGRGGDRARGPLSSSSVHLGSELNGQKDTADWWWPWPAPPEGDGASLTLSMALLFTSTWQWVMSGSAAPPTHTPHTWRPILMLPETQLLKLTCYLLPKNSFQRLLAVYRK